jgi:hypothetical protein
MKNGLCIALCCAFGLLIPSFNIRAQEEKQMIKFPAAKDQPVIVLKYTGGFRAPDPVGFTPSPFLQVFADGRVVTGQNEPKQPIFEVKLDPAEVEKLADFMVNVHKFNELDSKKIAARIEAIPDRMRIADAPMTEITLTTEKGSHTCAVYALGLAAREMKSIEEVGRLFKIEGRLKALHCIATLGLEKAEALTAEANKFLQTNHPELKLQMTKEDLRWVSKIGERTQISFIRDDTAEAEGAIVTIEQTTRGNSISVRDTK